jgi:hypothetical protein
MPLKSIPPQTTVSFYLIYRQETSIIFKSPLASCLRDLAGKHGKRLTEVHEVI